MPYPPPLPPDTRENSTPQADNHPQDHNSLVWALEDIIGVLGAQPQGPFTGSVMDRLAWLTYEPGVQLMATVGAAPNKIVLHCGPSDVLVANSAGITLAVPLTATSISASGAISAASLAASAGITAASVTASGRITANDYVTTGPYYLNPGGTALVSDSGGATARLYGTLAELRNAAGNYAQLTATSLVTAPPSSGTDWNARPLVISGNPYGAIGLNSVAISNAGSIQLFTSAVAAAGFHFVNGVNNAYHSCHAAKFVEASSRRYKTDVAPFTLDGIDLCGRLAPVTYRTKGEDGEPVGITQLGFIAEDVAEVVPHVVDRDADGRPEGLAYTSLIPVLVDAINRLDRRLAHLEGS